MNTNPTIDFYNLFQYIYEYYNDNLYKGELPNCMFVIIRKKNTFGYFIPERWVNNEKIKSDEIAINPLMFGSYPLIEILKTIVHEMCHLWQFHFGDASIRTYHNKEWGDKLESVGLIPSNTGKPGGKKTGQQMMEYIDESGLFIKESEKLIETNIFKTLWYDRFMSAPVLESQLSAADNSFENNSADVQSENSIDYIVRSVADTRFHSNIREELFVRLQNNTADKKKKIKYTCQICNSNVWGKPDLNIKCNDCNENYTSN